MNDPVTVVARASAERLAAEYGTNLIAEVETALHARRMGRRPDQYAVDPVSLGSLIVSITSLAWTVYADLKKKAPNPPPEDLARRISIDIGEHPGYDQTDRITSVVILEIVKRAEMNPEVQELPDSPRSHQAQVNPPELPEPAGEKLLEIIGMRFREVLDLLVRLALQSHLSNSESFRPGKPVEHAFPQELVKISSEIPLYLRRLLWFQVLPSPREFLINEHFEVRINNRVVARRFLVSHQAEFSARSGPHQGIVAEDAARQNTGSKPYDPPGLALDDPERALARRHIRRRVLADGSPGTRHRVRPTPSPPPAAG
jgi:hypothetical protein